MLQIDEDLDNLPQILGAEAVDQRPTDLLRQELIQRLPPMSKSCHLRCAYSRTDLFKRLINDIRVLEMVVGEEVELVEEVPYINAAKRVHL